LKPKRQRRDGEDRRNLKRRALRDIEDREWDEEYRHLDEETPELPDEDGLGDLNRKAALIRTAVWESRQGNPLCGSLPDSANRCRRRGGGCGEWARLLRERIVHALSLGS
jgi:hypothetical protein